MYAFRVRTAMLLRRFAGDRRGNIAVIFALVLTPVVGAIGMALDLGRAGAVQTKLQNATDIAALALALEPSSVSDEALAVRAADIIEANFTGHQASEIATVSVVRGDDEITVDVEVAMPASFASLVGLDSLSISASSNTVWGGNPIELALVLDNTGSMDREDKLETLQDAVGDMLDMLENTTSDAAAVRVAIVPFATQVRLDTSYEDEDWLLSFQEAEDAEDDGGDGHHGWWWDYWRYGRWGHGSYDDEDEAWDGCVTDRNDPYDTDDTAATTDDTLYPAAACDTTRLEEILPLTSDFDDLRDKVDDMRADGNTNVTIGVAWGMAALSPQEPLDEASEEGEVPGLHRVMVVLTDGENTENRFEESTWQIDQRTARACQSAKDMGVAVYTVRVINGNEDLLRECATDDTHYFDVEDVDDLLPVFQTIGTRISKLRVAR